jgi:hypothetical protein
MGAQASSPPGTVTFSVYNPAASVTYWLPTQTLANSGVNSCQMNLQNTGNPGSIDHLVINGSNNFASVANLTGLNNWGTGFVQAQALNYVAPTSQATPLPVPLPAPVQVSQFLDYAKFIQRDIRTRSMKGLDDGDGEYKAVVDVGDAEVNDGGVDCASLRKKKDAVLPPECRAKNI